MQKRLSLAPAAPEIAGVAIELELLQMAYDGARVVAQVRDLTARLPDLAATVKTKCDSVGLRHTLLDQLVDRIADNAGRVSKRG